MCNYLVTGANGNLGRRLIRETLLADSANRVTAVVRSERARDTVAAMELPDEARARLTLEVLSYTDINALNKVCLDVDRVVHTVGIIKEAQSATYEDAHEASCEALVAALKGTQVKHVTYLSIVGSKPDSNNACLASKGRAEEILLGGEVPCCVLQVPMVLGEGDYASFALKKRASGGLAFGFRMASLEQPIYAGDVVRAIVAAGEAQLDARLELGGPEVIDRGELTRRAAAVLGTSPRVVSLPIGLGRAVVKLLESISGNPPMTVAMLNVLDHDDRVDPQPACEVLGLEELTGLDEMMRRVFEV